MSNKTEKRRKRRTDGGTQKRRGDKRRRRSEKRRDEKRRDEKRRGDIWDDYPPKMKVLYFNEERTDMKRRR
jgi:hypothetical protein